MRTIVNKLRLAPATRGLGTRVVGPYPPWWVPSAGGGGAPAPTDPYFSDVVLLMHMEGANNGTTFIDSSSVGRSVTAAGAVHTNTSQFVFGTASAHFPNSPGYLYFNPAESFSDFNLGLSNEPFTVEFWVRLHSTSATQILFGKGGGTAGWYNSTGNQYMMFLESSILYFQWWTSGTNPNTISKSVASIPGGWATNTWYHIGVDYDGTTTRLLFNGNQLSTGTAAYSERAQATIMRVGAGPYGYPVNNGYIDDFRITKGVARYAGPYSIPTETFPDQ